MSLCVTIPLFADDRLVYDEVMEEFISVQCPFCAQDFSVELDVTAGQDQVFIVDCETCCRPVECHVTFNEAGEYSHEVRAEG